MKKLSTLLTLVLLLLVAPRAVAQDVPQLIVVGDATTDPIDPDQEYVLRGGVSAGFHGTNRYLTPGSAVFVDTPDESCVFRFVPVGTKNVDDVGAVPTYALFNIELGCYFTASPYQSDWSVITGWSRYLADAFVFTAAVAVAGQGPAGWDGTYGFAQYYNLVSPDYASAASGGQAYVFCGIDSGNVPRYLSYYMTSNIVNWYFNLNDWYLCPVTKRDMTAREQFEAAFNEVFPSGFDASNYVAGTTPGCYPQSALDAMTRLYEEAMEASYDMAMADDALIDLAKRLREGKAAFDAAFVGIVPGYYIMRSKRSTDAVFDNGATANATSAFAIPETFDATTARYIWQTVDNGAGRLYLRNVATGRYLNAGGGTSVQFTTGEQASATFSFPHSVGSDLAIRDQNGNYAHVDASMRLVQWNYPASDGNRFEFTPIDESLVTPLASIVEQQRLTSRLATLIKEAEATKKSMEYVTDCTLDDQYASAGLADPALMSTNAPEPNEGYDVAEQFTQLSDGNLETYFHTTWSNSNATTWHYLQVDLGKAVDRFFLKMSQRHNNRDGSPRRVAFVTNDDVLADNWLDTLCVKDISYDYATTYAAGVRDTSTAVVLVEFDKPVQHLRMAVQRTYRNQMFGAGPCWYASEVRFYEIEGENTLVNLIPDEVKNALEQALTAARDEVAAGAATQPTYDALRAAIDAYLAAYPNPAPLTALLAEATAMANSAEEGTDVGYYAPGAASTLLGEVQDIEGEIEGKTLSTTEIAAYMERLQAAIDAFKLSLNKPADGLYRLQSTSPSGAANGHYVLGTAASTQATAAWGYGNDANLSARLDAIWYLTNADDGSISLRNVATGLYLGNTFTQTDEPDAINLSVALNYTVEPSYFQLGTAGEGGFLNLQMYDGRWVNAAPGGAIVNWNGSEGNSCFQFVPVDESEFAGEVYVEFPLHSLQIVTLPFDVDGGWVTPVAHKVLGKTVDQSAQTLIQLEPYAEGETVPAGTPFVVQRTNEESLYAFTTEYSLEAILNGEHGYEPVEQNGMVGAPFEVAPGAGNGLLTDGVVRILREGETVPTGTGYFTDRIPTTEETGTIAIPVEGVISALPGAVVVLPNSSTDVYTISGIKVRSGVTGTKATQGLPAGLYIIAGQKVLVR